MTYHASARHAWPSPPSGYGVRDSPAKPVAMGMRLTHAALVAPLALAVALASGSAPAHAEDPLLCIDLGAVDVGPHSVDPPEVCIL